MNTSKEISPNPSYADRIAQKRKQLQTETLDLLDNEEYFAAATTAREMKKLNTTGADGLLFLALSKLLALTEDPTKRSFIEAEIDTLTTITIY